MPESKKRSLKSVPLMVDHQMTTGMAWGPVSNMVIPKNKVTSGRAWHPVSHRVSPKGVFDCSKSAKIAKKFFGGGKLVVRVNEVIKTILGLFIFFTRKFQMHKNSHKQKETNKTKISKQAKTN